MDPFYPTGLDKNGAGENLYAVSWICTKSALLQDLYICWLVSRHMQFPAKAKKSYAVHKMIKPARLVQKCFETSILYKVLQSYIFYF